MINKFIERSFILIFFITVLVSWKPVPPPDMSEVLKVADFYRGGQVPGVMWDLNVQNIEKGSLKNEISLMVEATSDDDNQFVLITFLKPRKYVGQKLLVRDNSMWFMRKGLRSPVPISSRQRLTGSASNADVSTANYYKDYAIIESISGTHEGKECWVLTLEAKTNLVSYPKIKYWITKDGNFGIYAKYFGKSEKLIKEASFSYKNKVVFQKKEYSYISNIVIVDKINKEDKTVLNIEPAQFVNFNNSKFQKDRLLD
ncbi:outer membrane lipoprotein-sorting protein [Ascidiimonas sp. W6]|uniref:outer membrane lipoprotein-sorting protein n=1 Tax=Ascidiimonas meishanensis TaxID=3128903 RepID=UPI0030EDCCF9